MAIIYLYVARKVTYAHEGSINSPRNIVTVVTYLLEAKDFFSWGAAPPTSNFQLYDMEFREVLRRIVASPNLTTPVIYVNDDRRRAIPPPLTGRILVSTVNTERATLIFSHSR